jgi:hypothetical protein
LKNIFELLPKPFPKLYTKTLKVVGGL